MAVKLDDKGLVPAIAQNADTGEVIMLGYMSPGSLKRTLGGRRRLVLQPQQGGPVAQGRDVGQLHACEVGVGRLRRVTWSCCRWTRTARYATRERRSASSRRSMKMPDFERSDGGPGVIDELFSVVQDRKRSLPEGSYTTELFRGGVDRIGQKVIEEAGEAVIAGVKLDKDALAREAADLLYHLLVLLSANGGKPEDIYAHLRDRRK